jgi:TatD DNase family protein
MTNDLAFFDTHSHIYIQDFTEDIEAIIERARNKNIVGIILPAIDSETHEALVTLAKNNKQYIFPMMGLHPCSVKENWQDELAIAKKYIDNSTVAIGEIGLDFYWDRTFEQQQKEAFNTQIVLAKELGLPINIHSRNATQECINIVKEHQDGTLQGIFHCFSGSYETAKQVVDLNFYMGIGGVVTYKNAGLGEVLAKFSLDNIVLETDAPYLTPVPFRGKRNEPAYIEYVVEKLCTVFQCTPTEVSKATMANTKKVFAKVFE